MRYVPKGEKPSSKTFGVGSVVMTWPTEASITETLRKQHVRRSLQSGLRAAYCSGDAHAKYLLSGE